MQLFDVQFTYLFIYYFRTLYKHTSASSLPVFLYAIQSEKGPSLSILQHRIDLFCSSLVLLDFHMHLNTRPKYTSKSFHEILF